MSRAVVVEVKPRYKDEPIEKMIRRFSKKCKKERVIEKYKDRQSYKKPSEKKRDKRARAARERKRQELKKKRLLEKSIRRKN